MASVSTASAIRERQQGKATGALLLCIMQCLFWRTCFVWRGFESYDQPPGLTRNHGLCLHDLLRMVPGNCLYQKHY